MNSISTKSHRNEKSSGNGKSTGSNKPGQVETAGSLALWQQGLLMAAMTDSFVSDAPFSVDYSAFGIDTDAVACTGFLSSFSNAMSILGGSSSEGGFSAGGGFASSGGGFSGGGGGFSSVC